MINYYNTENPNCQAKIFDSPAEVRIPVGFHGDRRRKPDAGPACISEYYNQSSYAVFPIQFRGEVPYIEYTDTSPVE